MKHATLCIGADVHLDEIVLCVVDKADGHEVTDHFRVTNNLPGAQAAATAIAELATRLGYTRIEIGWEATGMLWIPFHRYLCDCLQLQPFELELVCFNPQLVTKFKDDLVLRRPKNDKLDASAVAARLRFGEWPLSCVPGDFWQGLRRLTRYRFHLSRRSAFRARRCASSPMPFSSAAIGSGSRASPTSLVPPASLCLLSSPSPRSKR